MEKVYVIPNGVDVTQFDPEARGEEFRRAWGAKERFVSSMQVHSASDGLEVVLDAAEELHGTPALFVLIGDGKARAELLAACAEARSRQRALRGTKAERTMRQSSRQRMLASPRSGTSLSSARIPQQGVRLPWRRHGRSCWGSTG